MVRIKTALFAFALLLAGSVTLQAAIPILVGTWTGTGKAVDLERGYYNVTYTVAVIDQNGRLFRGSLTMTTPTGSLTQRFTGIIKADGTIAVNYRKHTGQKATEAASWGVYIAPTTEEPNARLEGYWLNASQDTGSMSLTKK
jgi:hypothetical protein